MRTTKRLILLVISTTKQIGNLAQAPPQGGAILLHLLNCAMTTSVAPKKAKSISINEIAPILPWKKVEKHILKFLEANPQGVRNTDVAKAIGFTDSRQWMSHGALSKMIDKGLVEKSDKALYFKA
jgi:hypothetical protein